MPTRDSLRCNGRIAAGLLDALRAVGDAAGLESVRRVFDDARTKPEGDARWLSTEVLDRAFRAVGRDRQFARRVGAGLVSNQRIGFLLFAEGVATIEKALRRCDSLFAREAPDGAFAAVEVGQGCATIVYRPGEPSRETSPNPGPDWNDSFCGVREGMLEALPLGFGLLPARVRETECAGQGATACRFEVEFGVRDLRFTSIGAGIGALAGAAVIAAAWSGAAPVLPWVALAAGSTALGGAAIGHAVDLARQLQAVAGARRGHLALLEQADHALAQKMDELAKLNAQGERATSANADRLRAVLEEREAGREGGDSGVTGPAPEGVVVEVDRTPPGRLADQLYEALGPLQRGVERVHRLVRENRDVYGDGGEALFDALRGVAEESRRLASVGESLAGEARGEHERFEPVELPPVLHRAVDAVRPLLAPSQSLVVKIAERVPRVPCEPFQLEQVAYQLLRNAAEASDRDGEFELRLETVPGGVELCVEDHGPGIPEEILDPLFDPFAIEGKPAGERGLGLAICQRIVTQHGGELRVSTEAGEGTRMTVALRCDDRDIAR